MVQVAMDDSTVALTSAISALAIFGIAKSLETSTGVALLIGAVSGVLLYSLGIVPIGLIAILLIGAAAAFGRSLFGRRSPPTSPPPVAANHGQSPLGYQKQANPAPAGLVDLQSVRHLGIGLRMAENLSRSFATYQIPDDERLLVERVGLSSATYAMELLVMSAVAQDHVLVSYFGESQADNHVRRGFLNHWSRLSNESAQGNALWHLFNKRGKEYDIPLSSREGRFIDRMSRAVSCVLGGSIDGSGELALLAVDRTFNSSTQVAIRELKKEGLIGDDEA